MIELRVLDLLKSKNKSKYWLSKQVDMSYQNFDKMIKNQTSSIRYDVIEQLCSALECNIADIFVTKENL